MKEQNRDLILQVLIARELQHLQTAADGVAFERGADFDDVLDAARAEGVEEGRRLEMEDRAADDRKQGAEREGVLADLRQRMKLMERTHRAQLAQSVEHARVEGHLAALQQMREALQQTIAAATPQQAPEGPGE